MIIILDEPCLGFLLAPVVDASLTGDATLFTLRGTLRLWRQMQGSTDGVGGWRSVKERRGKELWNRHIK